MRDLLVERERDLAFEPGLDLVRDLPAERERLFELPADLALLRLLEGELFFDRDLERPAELERAREVRAAERERPAVERALEVRAVERERPAELDRARGARTLEALDLPIDRPLDLDFAAEAVAPRLLVRAA